MKMSNVKTIFLKELKDTLRDRRTMFLAFLMPILMMPVIMIGILKLQMSAISDIQGERQIVVVEGLDQLPTDLRSQLENDTTVTVKSSTEFSGKDLKQEVIAGRIPAYVLVPERFGQSLDLESQTDIEVYYEGTEERSSAAYSKVKELLTSYREGVVTARVQKRNLPEDLLEPYKIVNVNLAPPAKQSGKFFGMLIPYFIVLTCFLGAMSPATDLGAGEKERGTIETLLVAPATRGEFVIGKYLVVLLTSITAGILTLSSMAVSFKYFANSKEMMMMKSMMNIQVGFDSVALILLVVVPLAGIFAAITLAVSIFAKSAKEAQGYLGMLNFLLVFPAFVSMIPGMKISPQTALIPVVNTSLIIKSVLSEPDSINWGLVMLAFFATFAFAAACLVFCKKWFEREEVLFRM